MLCDTCGCGKPDEEKKDKEVMKPEGETTEEPKVEGEGTEKPAETPEEEKKEE